MHAEGGKKIWITQSDSAEETDTGGGFRMFFGFVILLWNRAGAGASTVIYANIQI